MTFWSIWPSRGIGKLFWRWYRHVWRHHSDLVRMRLLVVEDNRNLARLLELRLSKAGFDLGSNPSEARAAATSSQYMAIVPDLGLADAEAPRFCAIYVVGRHSADQGYARCRLFPERG